MFVIPPNKLNARPDDISLMSYNILLPNSEQGWWVNKYYHPEIPLRDRSWASRKKLLIEQLPVSIDLFTLQECALDTYETDLDFLIDTHTLLCHKRARIAMVTAWKTERFELLADYHLNRTLVSVLREQTGALICVVNCHLSAGRHPKERFQQVAKAMKQVEKLKNRFALDLIVFSGDFNSSSEGTAVLRFLEDGIVEPRFREAFYPSAEITSKIKEHRIGRFEEVYRHVTDATTMWVRNSGAAMLHPRKRTPLKPFLDALGTLFNSYSADGEVLTESEVEQWIRDINFDLRGSEYRSAVERMTDGHLSRADFIEIYLSEVNAGKHWAVYNDFLRKNILIPKPRPYIARYALDQVWLRSTKYECTGVVPPLSSEAKQRIEAGDFPPNQWHPSDHFPLMVRFSPRLW